MKKEKESKDVAVWQDRRPVGGDVPPVPHLIVDGNVAVGQRESRGGGGGGGQRRSGKMDGVLVEGVEHGVGGPTVTHVHDLKAGLHPRGDESQLETCIWPPDGPVS